MVSALSKLLGASLGAVAFVFGCGAVEDPDAPVPLTTVRAEILGSLSIPADAPVEIGVLWLQDSVFRAQGLPLAPPEPATALRTLPDEVGTVELGIAEPPPPSAMVDAASAATWATGWPEGVRIAVGVPVVFEDVDRDGQIDISGCADEPRDVLRGIPRDKAVLLYVEGGTFRIDAGLPTLEPGVSVVTPSSHVVAAPENPQAAVPCVAERADAIQIDVGTSADPSLFLAVARAACDKPATEPPRELCGAAGASVDDLGELVVADVHGGALAFVRKDQGDLAYRPRLEEAGGQRVVAQGFGPAQGVALTDAGIYLGADGRVAWLPVDGAEAPVALWTGKEVGAVRAAPGGSVVWVGAEDGGGVGLWRVRPTAPQTAERVAEVTGASAASLPRVAVSEDAVYWWSPGSGRLMWRGDGDGAPKTGAPLAAATADAVVLAADGAAVFVATSTDADGQLYSVATDALTDGPWEALGPTHGVASAALGGGALWWTTPLATLRAAGTRVAFRPLGFGTQRVVLDYDDGTLYFVRPGVGEIERYVP